jgi:hypothetical protein
MDWSCGSSGRAPALQALSSNSILPKKKKKKKELRSLNGYNFVLKCA